MSGKIIVPAGAKALGREGLQEVPQPWENGLRTENRPDAFERWYFEAVLSGGESIEITFFTKPILEREVSLKPGVALTIHSPGQKKRSQVRLVDPAAFSASRDRCYVRAGESYLRAEDGRFELHVRAGDLSAHLTFEPRLPAWRPGAGKLYANQEEKEVFGWLVPVPAGTVRGLLTLDGKLRQVQGSGYHDHRWGGSTMNEVLGQWYWGRASAGPFDLVFTEFTGAPAFGRQRIPFVFLAYNNKLLTETGQAFTFDELDFDPDPGGRSYPTGMNIRYEAPPDRIHLALRSPELLDSFSMVDYLRPLRRLVDGIVANPYYFRFQTDLALDIQCSTITTRENGRAWYELLLLR